MNTSARMLRLLSLLQTHRYWPGGELADRLEVSARTLRRDIDRLRELGYPVDASRGVAGGYQLRSGASMPPLLLEDEEAVAIAVGLRTAAAGAVGGLEETAVQALTKVIGLMPPRLRRRMDALQSQTLPAPTHGPVVEATTLTALAQGCRDAETVRFGYTARGAEPTQRHVEPRRLVTIGRRWYLVAWDRSRDDWRSFRVDRIDSVEPTGARFLPRELPATDELEFVRAGLNKVPRRHDVRLRVAAPVAEVEERIGRWADLTEQDGSTLVQMQVDDFFWPLVLLATFDAPFEVESPDELREAVAAAAARFTTAVERG